jgi:hypothetical protein
LLTQSISEAGDGGTFYIERYRCVKCHVEVERRTAANFGTGHGDHIAYVMSSFLPMRFREFNGGCFPSTVYLQIPRLYG